MSGWPFPILQNAEGWPMQTFVVYENPKDAKPGYPYVIRRWEIVRGIDGQPLPERGVPCEAMGAATLELARSLIPSGLVNIGRYPDDDKAILEVWINRRNLPGAALERDS